MGLVNIPCLIIPKFMTRQIKHHFLVQILDCAKNFCGLRKFEEELKHLAQIMDEFTWCHTTMCLYGASLDCICPMATPKHYSNDHFATRPYDERLIVRHLKPADVPRIVAYICTNVALVRVTFIECSFTARIMQAIMSALINVPSLCIIDITHSHISAEGTFAPYKVFCQHLPRMPQLQGLALMGNAITSTDAAHLAHAVAFLHNLHWLNIANNNFRTHGITLILAAIRQHRHMRILNISHNAFNDPNCAIVANYLNTTYSTGLQILRMRQTGNITSAGLAAVCEAAIGMPSLSILALPQCNARRHVIRWPETQLKTVTCDRTLIYSKSQ